MKLATAQDVYDRMSSSGAAAGGTTTANSVLEAATPIIENILGSPLESAERIDFFDFDPSVFDTPTLAGSKFYLTQMFVDGNVKVYLSPDGAPLSSVTGLTPLAEGVSTFAQLGEVLLASESVYVGPSTIAMKYSAGFSDASPDIPTWLKEAAISSAVRVMHSQTIAHNKKDVPDMSVELHRIVYQQINNRIRPRYFGYYPAQTMVL